MYPLIYGDGLEDVLVRTSKGYSKNTDSLVGGLIMKSTNTSQGFLMRVAFDGRIRWQRLFNTDDLNADAIIHVDTFESLSFAVARTTTQTARTFYVVKFDESGTIVKNERLANYPSGIFLTSIGLD